MVFRAKHLEFHDNTQYAGDIDSLLKLHGMAIVDNIYRFLEQSFAKDFGRSSADETVELTKSYLKHSREDKVANRQYMQQLSIDERTLAGQMAIEELRAESAETQTLFNTFGNLGAALLNPVC